jgi:hypothetical protein
LKDDIFWYVKIHFLGWSHGPKLRKNFFALFALPMEQLYAKILSPLPFPLASSNFYFKKPLKGPGTSVLFKREFGYYYKN